MSKKNGIFTSPENMTVDFASQKAKTYFDNILFFIKRIVIAVPLIQKVKDWTFLNKTEHHIQ